MNAQQLQRREFCGAGNVGNAASRCRFTLDQFAKCETGGELLLQIDRNVGCPPLRI